MQGKNYVTGLKMLKAYPEESDGLCSKANESVAEGQNWSSPTNGIATYLKNSIICLSSSLHVPFLYRPL